MKNRIDDNNHPQGSPKETSAENSSFTLAGKLRDYLMLFKFSLNIMVVFSAVICFLLAPGLKQYVHPWLWSILFCLGGFLVTGSANTINQIVEKDTDAKMKRTATRPIASGRMSEAEGWIVAVIAGVAGIWILGTYFNWLSARIALFSLFLYAFIYTPLKKVNSISVLVGAIPGALPCLIGWAAGNDSIFPGEHGVRDLGGWALFAIQFFWQFPHFWAIALFRKREYAQAGFPMMPLVVGDDGTRWRSLAYTVAMVVVSLVPVYLGDLHLAYAVAACGLGGWFTWKVVHSLRGRDTSIDYGVFRASIAYLTLLFLFMLVDLALPWGTT